jgi:hypothetical protein
LKTGDVGMLGIHFTACHPLLGSQFQHWLALESGEHFPHKFPHKKPPFSALDQEMSAESTIYQQLRANDASSRVSDLYRCSCTFQLSAAMLGINTYKQEVAGSSPALPTKALRLNSLPLEPSLDLPQFDLLSEESMTKHEQFI